MAETGNTVTKSAAQKAKVETMSTRQLAMQLAEKHELSKKQANEIMDDITGIITKHLKKGIRIRLNGLGILQVRRRAARMGRNPPTGGRPLLHHPRRGRSPPIAGPAAGRPQPRRHRRHDRDNRHNVRPVGSRCA